MYLRFLKYLLTSFLILSFSTTLYAQSKKSTLFQVTFPRTGTHYLNYMLKALTYSQKVSTSEVIDKIYWCHSLEAALKKSQNGIRKPPNYDVNRDYLVIIIRNYKEAMIRAFGAKPKKIYRYLTDEASFCSIYRYFDVISTYESWNPDKRHLIYYENLVSNPGGEAVRLARFLKSSKHLLNNYLNDIEFHATRSRSKYNAEHTRSGSQSNTNILYHSKKLKFEDLKKIENLVKKKNPYLYNKYLKRYGLSKKNYLELQAEN